ncbi:hypothetical protein LOK46_13510 [Methylobacterium sp. NMS14P]|uniref:hypothetical protein n=1 Tax=Methylobacterium sp. NMS14P TaxID=2894310 RepID=UPI0023585C24|nr:hypothetical protein [Methylobacterium sp. NMS14P]WCS27792.1 hypothetical protein LOK46_13510 [Methylobacterium sp. NMS14P]
MPIAAAGTLNQRIQFLRRGAGGFAAIGPVQWGRLEFERALTVNVVGVTLQGRGGKLTVRACDLTRGLKVGDRCELDGDVFTITIRKAPEVDLDDVHLEIESAPTPALYAEEIDRRGEVIKLQRRRANSNPVAYEPQIDVRAIVTGYAPSELVGGITQGDSRVILLAADLVAGGFPLPIQTGGLDSVVIGGRQRTFRMVDDNSHRVAGALLAYDCTVRG